MEELKKDQEEVKVEINHQLVKMEEFINRDLDEVLRNNSRRGITGL